MNNIALITGATSGIGKASAKMLAKHGYDIIITGRRAQRLQQLKKDIETEFNNRILPLCFDIRNEEETTQALNSITDEWRDVHLLINNAGLAAGTEKIYEDAWDKWGSD